ncbi:LysR family transcriptional regulator [Catellatospora citrea]|uniref:LysR family transcriptional regulator n=1 Tax=Catellatospora citrea TaxID=53366 RepID=A0A8J3NX80_9ACTN|nr:LysR family transcriptional regulator [Catellatospora citrea]RKE12634.1 DNA-binding transcriptional LysR family regulator [Catellatospora citrea]GIF96130.1 LysR family transcriptional regulator [Catellatospora citrea]
MELRQLEHFVAVAEEANFTRAAARLHVVQSAVSATIKNLERELGTPLLERTTKRVLLTDAGAALLPRAHAALNAAQEAADAVAEVRGGLRGTLRVGTMATVGLIDLPALLGEFHRRHPGVLLQTSAAASGSQGLIDALLERRLDLAFVSLPGPHPMGITLTELVTSVLDLVVPADHPLANRGSVPITELAGLDFVDFPASYGIRNVADQAFAAASVTRRVALEITDLPTGVAYVRNGLGVALLPRPALADAADVATLTIDDTDLNWPFSLAAPSERTPGRAARALIAITHEFLIWRG